MPFMTNSSGVRMEVKVFKTRIAVLFPGNRNLLVVLVSPGQLKPGSLQNLNLPKGTDVGGQRVKGNRHFL